MRLINIYVNGCLASKDRDEAYIWLENAIKNHYEFKIEWVEVENELHETFSQRTRKKHRDGK